MKISEKKSLSLEAKKLYLDHDGYFRETFEMTRIGRAFLKKVLPPETLARLNLKKLTVEKRHFKDELFKDKIADVVYRVPVKETGKHVDFFVILEHKSYSDNLVIFQLWCYIFHLCRLIFQLAKDKKELKSDFKFPPVIVIIVHHGRSQFRGVTELAKLFFSIPGLEKYLPQLRAILFDLNDIPDDDPRLNDQEVPEFRVVVMVLKIIFRKNAASTLKQVLEELKPYSDDPTTRRLIRLTWIYVNSSAAHLKRNYEALLKTFQNVLGDENMPTMIQTWYAEGKAEGEAEGEAKSIIRILVRKWNRVPKSLQKRILAITDAEKLNELFDIAWDCKSLEEFAQNMP